MYEIFIFLSNHYTVFQSSKPIYISTNSAQEFPFLHILTLTSCFSDNGHSSRREVVSYCSFDLHFPDD